MSSYFNYWCREREIKWRERKKKKWGSRAEMTTAAGPASWLLWRTFIQHGCEPFLSGKGFNAHIMTVSSEEKGLSLTLPLIESLKTYSAVKGWTSEPSLPGHYFQTHWHTHSVPGRSVNESHFRQFTLQYGKSLDSLERTNSSCFVIIFDWGFYYILGMKERWNELRDESSERPYWSHPKAIDRSYPLIMK